MESRPINVIAFEGANRSGKGTQIKLLSDFLNNYQLPHLVVRGDGSRAGDGLTPGDPSSEWWTDVNKYLREANTDKQLWNLTSYRLARELLIWRNRIMPRVLQEANTNQGFLLVDRSILSRTQIPRELMLGESVYNLELYSHEMRPDGIDGKKGRIVSLEDVFPDLIIDILVPKEKLLERLSEDNPKDAWRRKIIEERYDWYINAYQFIPSEYQSRIISINGDQEPSHVFSDIIYIINERFNLSRIGANGENTLPG